MHGRFLYVAHVYDKIPFVDNCVLHVRILCVSSRLFSSEKKSIWFNERNSNVFFDAAEIFKVSKDRHSD